ncbi:MAG: histidinol-phosphate transaminase [bacterium]
MDVSSLIRPEIREMTPYQPVRPFESLSEEVGLPIDQIIKLDANENPYGCPRRVREALANYEYYHIYPDSFLLDLRERVGEYAGVGAQNVILGNGSDELIDLIFRLFLSPGDEVINFAPTFGMYSFVTELCGGKLVDVTRREDFSIDVDRARETLRPRTKMVVVCSPNNPTGNLSPEEDIRKLLEFGRVVVVDEAYYEFSKTTVAPLVGEYDNLIVLRTFSKFFGLAGLRIGYGIFPLKIADHIWRMKPPYSVNLAAQIAVRESLSNLEFYNERVKTIIEEREILYAELEKIEEIKPYPSRANFVFCKVLEGNAYTIKKTLEQRGVFIRYFHTPLLENSFRVSVGRPEQNKIFLRNLKEVLRERRTGGGIPANCARR